MPFFCIHCAAPQPTRRDALHHCPPPKPVKQPRPGRWKTLKCVICAQTAEGYRPQLIAAGWKDTGETVKCPAHYSTRNDPADHRVPEMIAMRCAGETLRAIAARYLISLERARQILKKHGAPTARNL